MYSALLVLPLVLGQVEPEPPAKERPYWLETARQHIAECEVFFAADPDHALKPHAEPVFHHIQSTRARSVGSVFLFVEPSGRPAAVGDVFMFPRGNKHELYNEWHSLADGPLTVRWSGGSLLACETSGVDWQTLADSPTAATTHTARERQLRQLARRFTARLINREQDKYELRLLTTPIYQYHADDETVSEAKHLGGGMFAFCQETDPEIFLLIEARSTEAGPAWHWAAAEFSNLRLFLELDGKQVWKADPPRFSSVGRHFGAKLKDVDLAAPATANP